MTLAFFSFTNSNHDLITSLASSFGAITTIGTFVGLYKNKWFGLLNIMLIGLNNLCYYDNELIVYLQVIQKISFAKFLIWICCINVNLYHAQGKAATKIGIANNGVEHWHYQLQSFGCTSVSGRRNLKFPASGNNSQTV